METMPYSIMIHPYTPPPPPIATAAAAVTIGLKRDEKFEYQILVVGTQIIRNVKVSLFLTFGGSTVIIML